MVRSLLHRGRGKSTLPRMIAGLEDISDGSLSIGGHVVTMQLPPEERGEGMLFQSCAIFPHMTMRENIAFGLTISGASRTGKDAKVAHPPMEPVVLNTKGRAIAKGSRA